MSRLRRWLRPPSTNYSLGALKSDPYTLLADGDVVLDLGAKQRGGGYWKGVERLRVISMDLVSAPGVDVLGDAHAIPLASSSVAAAICVSVLMYTSNPPAVIGELRRVLKPGGIIFLNAPFVYRYAPDGIDKFRFSVGGLRALASDFEEIQCGFNRGPASTMADMLSYFLAIVTCFNNTRLFNLLVDAYQWVLFPMKYLDRLVGNYDSAGYIYSAAFFMGRKR